MADGALYIATWNVRGLCDKNRTAVVKNWVQILGHPIQVLCLQEIKAGDSLLQQTLRTILPEHHMVVAPPQDTRGGTAILVHLDLSICAKRTFNFGQAAWVQLTAQGEDFGIVSVYAPCNSARERAVLRHILTNQLAAE
jgi:exonuclease III